MSIRESSIVRSALRNGIAATAYEYNLGIREVNEIVFRAIQDHQDVMERHQDSIAELRNLLNTRVCNDASCYKCGKVGHIASNYSDDIWCSTCLKTGHMTRDCKGGDGCCKCSSVGHLGKDCPEDWCFVGGGRLCYYCGLWGYMAVCSLCVFDGAFGGVRDEEVVVGKGVVVTSSSLEMLTNSCLGGIMVSLIFLEVLKKEALVEYMVELFKEDDKKSKKYGLFN
nr:DNA-binding protein HEXBP-like isoform X1 [Tanacetum cinerariifolium]